MKKPVNLVPKGEYLLEVNSEIVEIILRFAVRSIIPIRQRKSCGFPTPKEYFQIYWPPVVGLIVFIDL